jgi:hypothetical protein
MVGLTIKIPEFQILNKKIISRPAQNKNIALC